LIIQIASSYYSPHSFFVRYIFIFTSIFVYLSSLPEFTTMAYTSAFILFLSLASQSLALPVAQAGAGATNVTFDDGLYRPTDTKAQATPVGGLPVTTLITTTSEGAQPVETATPAAASSVPTTADGAQSTGTIPITSVTYKKFNGDGSEAAGWPAITEWVSFDQM
jgi:hypothetical protein